MGRSRLHLASVRVEIPEHRHCAERLLRGGFRPMKVLHGIENSVLVVDQSIHQVTGAIGQRIGKGEFEVLGSGSELGEFITQDLGQVWVGRCPFPKAA